MSTKETWKRAPLPNDQKPTVGITGALIAGIGIITAFLGGATAINEGQPFGWMFVAMGSACVSLGLVLFGLGLIVTEIRHAAFDAARRAGEVMPADVDR